MEITPHLGIQDPFSCITHFAAAAVFAVRYRGLLREGRGHPRLTASLTVYAASCVLLLTMSGLYHLLPEGTARSVMRRLDLAAIFVLIAGTHTPVQTLFFRGIARWGVLALMWTIVAIGITFFSVAGDDLPRGAGTGTFLLLGWMAGMSGLAVWRRHGFNLVRPLVLGGLAYSSGAIFLGLEWPWIIPGVIGPHECWHVAVILGVSLHWRFMRRIGSHVRASRREAAGSPKSVPGRAPDPLRGSRITP